MRVVLTLLLLIFFALPCPAADMSSEFNSAISLACSRLAVSAEDIRPVLPSGHSADAAGHWMAAQNMAVAVGRVTAVCDSLAHAAGVQDLLELVGLPQDSPHISPLPRALHSVADSLGRWVGNPGRVLALLMESNTELHQAFSLLSPADKVELRRLTTGFEFWADQWPDYPVLRMIELAERVDRSRIAVAASLAAAAVMQITAGAGESDLWPAEPVRLPTPWGDIVVGTTGRDHHNSRAMLIVDPGGDDSYDIPPGAWPAVCLVVDFAGDDSYEASGGRALGGAVMGVSWLEDLAGNDTYTAGPFSLGCGVLGAGVLVDRAGDDRYTGSHLCQGASFYGAGALLDLNGRDIYHARFCAQGASFADGSALLADLAGNDSYYCAGEYPDFRSPGATRSFAQGCAAGIRPFADGGRAVLYDRGGRDSYRIGYLGQGAGYWGGFGLLDDSAGADTLVAQRYAQGCGLHMAAGALVNIGGDDSYTLEGVGQGCGEDRAWGIMLEAAGNDTYNSARMSLGAAGTGGVGLLLELAGDDIYPSRGQVTLGAGSRTWELPGLGLMLEIQGNDTYGDSDDNGEISENGTWGARLDLPPDD